jgi:MinD-like ATPase involved in chromosome partitioning or flagellar assembly
VYIVTFYSYKGGVGRTLALMNTAARLAELGRRVFIIDFDLEAPGVDAFCAAAKTEPRQGIVEYISYFKTTGKPASLRDYVFSADIRAGSGGQVSIMAAGRKDRDYQTQLSSLDWKMLRRQSSESTTQIMC